MSTEAHQGPSYTFGDMENLAASFTGSAMPDYNPDAGPSASFQGGAFPDVRFLLQKSKLNGFSGVQPVFLESVGTYGVDAVPAAFGTANIAALAHTTNGTPMTLVTTNAAGITTKVPIIPYTGTVNGLPINGTPTVPAIVLDFGFAFGTTTLNSTTVTVADSTNFWVGMPLVIPAAGASGATLLTWVTGLPTATTITINDKALSAVTATPIGTGNIWPGAPLSTGQQQYSTAHLPYLAGGPGLFLDPQQSIARGVAVTTGTGGTGGNITISGWDLYWQPMTEVIAASATGSTTVYGKKAFKAIKSATPAFTDGTGTYSIGTSDVFGFALKARRYELVGGAWAAGFLTGSTGFLPYTAPASGDVRGTFQVSGKGGGTGFGSTNSNGAVSSLVMTGNRLCLYQNFSVADTIQATARAGNGFGPTYLYGVTQT